MGNTGSKGVGDVAHQQKRERIFASPHCLSLDADRDVQGLLLGLEKT
jgi:hypothetical protein